LEDCNFGEYEPDTQPLCFEITFARSGRQIILRAEAIETVYSWLNSLLKHKFIKESEIESRPKIDAKKEEKKKIEEKKQQVEQKKVEKKVEEKKVEEKPKPEDLNASGSFISDEIRKRREKHAKEEKERKVFRVTLWVISVL
jgi:septal ring factor EnvC (AmiA/AmiB activator)